MQGDPVEQKADCGQVDHGLSLRLQILVVDLLQTGTSLHVASTLYHR